MSLKGILKLIYALGLIVIALGLVAYLGVFQLGNSIERLSSDRTLTELIGDLQKQSLAVVMPANDYLITGDTAEKENFSALDREFSEIITELDKVLAGQEEKAILARLKSTYSEVRTESLKILALPNPRTNPAGGAMMEAMDAKAGEMDKTMEELHELIRKKTNASIKDAQSKKRSTMFIVVIFSILAVTFSVFVTKVFQTGIIHPLMDMSKTAKKVAEGNLTVEVTKKAKGEIGELINVFNDMVRELQLLIQNILSSTKTVSETTGLLSSSANTTSMAMQTVAAAVQEIAKGSMQMTEDMERVDKLMGNLAGGTKQIASSSQQQASIAVKAANVSDEIHHSVANLTHSAQNVLDASMQTDRAAEAGALAVSQTGEGMNRIKETVYETAGKIKNLDQYSQEIDTINQVIEDIAEQTNLLALNAAIEAARAGEQGKGFAVVSDEVRKLAERSGKATKEIATLIANIQRELSETVGAINKGTITVEEGTKLAETAGEALNQIRATAEQNLAQARTITAAAHTVSSQSDEVLAIVEQLSAISQESTTGTQQMAADSNEISTVFSSMVAYAEENAASSQQISASTEQVMATTEQLSASSQQLTEMAGDLEQLVSRFKV